MQENSCIHKDALQNTNTSPQLATDYFGFHHIQPTIKIELQVNKIRVVKFELLNLTEILTCKLKGNLNTSYVNHLIITILHRS